MSNTKRKRCPKCNRLYSPGYLETHITGCQGKAAEKLRQPGETYRPWVTIVKAKQGTPTVVVMSGRVYILRPGDQYQGGGRG